MQQLAGDIQTARVQAERARVATQYGISTTQGPNGEPSDADLLLTGSDEIALLEQAQRLGDVERQRLLRGNVAPREGSTVNTGSSDRDGIRAFTRKLFGNDEWD